MGVFTLYASNIKRFAFQFAHVRPMWIGPQSLRKGRPVVCELKPNVFLRCAVSWPPDQRGHKSHTNQRFIIQCGERLNALPLEEPILVFILIFFFLNSIANAKFLYTKRKNNCKLLCDEARTRVATSVCSSIGTPAHTSICKER